MPSVLCGLACFEEDSLSTAAEAGKAFSEAFNWDLDGSAVEVYRLELLSPEAPLGASDAVVCRLPAARFDVSAIEDLHKRFDDLDIEYRNLQIQYSRAQEALLALSAATEAAGPACPPPSRPPAASSGDGKHRFHRSRHENGGSPQRCITQNIPRTGSPVWVDGPQRGTGLQTSRRSPGGRPREDSPQSVPVATWASPRLTQSRKIRQPESTAQAVQRGCAPQTSRPSPTTVDKDANGFRFPLSEEVAGKISAPRSPRITNASPGQQQNAQRQPKPPRPHSVPQQAARMSPELLSRGLATVQQQQQLSASVATSVASAVSGSQQQPAVGTTRAPEQVVFATTTAAHPSAVQPWAEPHAGEGAGSVASSIALEERPRRPHAAPLAGCSQAVANSLPQRGPWAGSQDQMINPTQEVAGDVRNHTLFDLLDFGQSLKAQIAEMKLQIKRGGMGFR